MDPPREQHIAFKLSQIVEKARLAHDALASTPSRHSFTTTIPLPLPLRCPPNPSNMPPRDEDVRNGRKGKLAAPSNPGTSLLDTAQRFWQRSYAGDYLGLAIIVVLYIPLRVFNEPFHQMFRLNDPRIQHPHAEVERVSVGTAPPHPRPSAPDNKMQVR